MSERERHGEDAARSRWPAVEGAAVLLATLYAATALQLPTLWFLVPLAIVTAARRPYEDYALTWRNPGSPLFHVIVTLAVFVPYAVGHYLWEHWYAGSEFHLRLPPALGREIAVQVLIVALPEEFFFRGYLQVQLDKTFGRPFRFLGARFGAGLPIAAAAFALCHVPFGGPGRLMTFFPGLLYGWLRARTGTIAVPVAYHAASNLLMRIMVTSLGPG